MWGTEFLGYLDKQQRVWEIVAYAKRTGELVPWPVCAVPECDGTKVHAHHADYDQPLLVTWLCPKHHAYAHMIGERLGVSIRAQERAAIVVARVAAKERAVERKEFDGVILWRVRYTDVWNQPDEMGGWFHFWDKKTYGEPQFGDEAGARIYKSLGGCEACVRSLRSYGYGVESTPLKRRAKPTEQKA